MKLGYLRTLVKNEENTFSFHKLFFGNSEDIINLRIFLQKRAILPNDYELAPADIYDLCKIMPVQSEDWIFRNIKMSYDTFHNNERFLEVFHFLDAASLIHKDNFTLMFKDKTGSILYDLFLHPSKKFLTLDAENFDALLTLISENWYSDKLVDIIHLLHRENSLNSNILNAIEISDFSKSILKVLAESKCLNDKNFSRMLNHKRVNFSLRDLFQLLDQNNIIINDEILGSIEKCDGFYSLNKSIELFLAAKKLNQTTLLLLIKADYLSDEKLSLLKILLDYSICNDDILNYICKRGFLNDFTNTIKTLDEYKLLNQNQKLIDKMVHQVISSEECAAFFEILKKLDVVDQAIIDLYVGNNDISWRKSFLSTLQLLEKVTIPIYIDQIKSLFTLTLLNLRRFYPILDELIQNKLFNPKSMEEALHIVTEKLPTPLEYTLADNDPVIEHSEKKEITFSNQQKLFMDPYKSEEINIRRSYASNDGSLNTKENENALKGGMGKVTKGYVSLDEKNPTYCVKQLNNPNRRLAKNEVKYNQFSGRHSFYFVQNNNVHIVYNWLQEKALSEFSEQELLTLEFAKRLQCLISGFDSLSNLHIHMRIHNDIKAANIILNTYMLTMEIIDFGGAHKKDGRIPDGWFDFPCTPEYKDPHTFGDHYCKDIYSASFIVKKLFPEIYPLTTTRETPLNTAEKAIQQLVNNMMDPNFKKRCTAKGAKDYCQTLLANIKSFDEVMLTQMSNALIDQSSKTVEDCVLKLR